MSWHTAYPMVSLNLPSRSCIIGSLFALLAPFICRCKFGIPPGIVSINKISRPRTIPIEHDGIFGEGSQIQINQNRGNRAFSLLIG